MPAGRYANPTICDEDNLRAVAGALARSAVRLLTCASFDAALASAAAGDFVYLDPPYAPVSVTAVFTSYTAEGFDGDQERLQGRRRALVRRECRVLLSNSAAPEITDLYAQPRCGSSASAAHTVPARRAINSGPAARGNVRRVPDHQCRAERLRADLIRIGVARSL